MNKIRDSRKPNYHAKARALLKGYFDALFKENRKGKRKIKSSLNSKNAIK